MEERRIRVVRRRTSTGEPPFSSAQCHVEKIPPLVWYYHIFSKLPVKSVMKCKCVCTTWHNIISEPHFSHFYSTQKSYLNRVLYVRSTGDRHHHRPAKLLELGNGDHFWGNINLKSAQNLEYVAPKHCIGSCNGFLCVLVPEPPVEAVIVFNPILGDTTIQLPGFQIIEDNISQGVEYHFGFNPSGPNFKVMRNHFKWDKGTKGALHYKIHDCKVFTVGVDEDWRNLAMSESLVYKSDVISFNGSFNWIPINTNSSWISTFDLDKEKWGRFGLPPGLDLDSNRQLSIFHDQFSVVEQPTAGLERNVSVWAMRTYAVADSWAKIFTIIKGSIIQPSLTHHTDLLPVAQLQGGEILVLVSQSIRLLTYNVNNYKYSEVGAYEHEKYVATSRALTFSPCFSHGVFTMDA